MQREETLRHLASDTDPYGYDTQARQLYGDVKHYLEIGKPKKAQSLLNELDSCYNDGEHPDVVLTKYIADIMTSTDIKSLPLPAESIEPQRLLTSIIHNAAHITFTDDQTIFGTKRRAKIATNLTEFLATYREMFTNLDAEQPDIDIDAAITAMSAGQSTCSSAKKAANLAAMIGEQLPRPHPVRRFGDFVLQQVDRVVP